MLEELAEMDCKTVNFSGGGEPTLHPDFGKILGKAAELGFRTWVVTHGGFIHKWLNELLMASHVRVSLDASNEFEHEEMHRSKAGEFERVRENIRALIAAKKGFGFGPEIGLSYLLWQKNSSPQSIERIIQWAGEVGVEFIHFRPLSMETSAAGDLPKSVTDAMVALERMAPVVARPQLFPISKRGTDVFLQREFAECYASLLFAVIGADGNVQACCDRRDIRFGNIYDRRFKDIWLGEEHLLKQQKIEPKLCVRCTMCSTNRGLGKYVVRDEALAGLM